MTTDNLVEVTKEDFFWYVKKHGIHSVDSGDHVKWFKITGPSIAHRYDSLVGRSEPGHFVLPQPGKHRKRYYLTRHAYADCPEKKEA